SSSLCMPIFILLFLCSCSRHPRDPHSFPTRRSSDLGSPPCGHVAGAQGDHDHSGHRQTHHERVIRFHSEQQTLHQSAAGDSEREDRKSTRLNSSHVEISYAVFCLKKKNKTTTTKATS